MAVSGSTTGDGRRNALVQIIEGTADYIRKSDLPVASRFRRAGALAIFSEYVRTLPLSDKRLVILNEVARQYGSGGTEYKFGPAQEKYLATFAQYDSPSNEDALHGFIGAGVDDLIYLCDEKIERATREANVQRKAFVEANRVRNRVEALEDELEATRQESIRATGKLKRVEKERDFLAANVPEEFVTEAKASKRQRHDTEESIYVHTDANGALVYEAYVRDEDGKKHFYTAGNELSDAIELRDKHRANVEGKKKVDQGSGGAVVVLPNPKAEVSA